MNKPQSLALTRRGVLRGAALSALAMAVPRAWAVDNPCKGPHISPDPDIPIGAFGAMSSAEEVTAGLDLSGMTAVVTGCNSGLGYETMRILAMRGAHVLGTARTEEKGEKACSEINGKATPVVLELSDFDSVAACAKAIKAMDLPIDMLICNAGIMALPELQLVYGLERQFVVNHLGHFLLTNLLIDNVKRAEQGRIVNVSSCAHEFAPEKGIEFDNLDGSKGYSGWPAYGQSKLANCLFTAELARRLDGSGVTANTLHPGVIKTNLARHLDEDPDDVDDSMFDKSIPQGAATQCYVATNPALSSVSGHYFVDCNPATANDFMYDAALAQQLWSVSEKLTGGYLDRA